MKNASQWACGLSTSSPNLTMESSEGLSESHSMPEAAQSPAQEKESSNSGTSEGDIVFPSAHSSNPFDAINALPPEFSSGKPIMSEGMFPQSSQQDSKFFPGLGLNVNLHFDEINKVYVCHLCDFRTAFRNSLLNHQAVHSDLRPWVCAMCEYAAKRKQDLKKHLHTVHGMMVESTQLKPVMGSFPNVNLPGVGPLGPTGDAMNFWDPGKTGRQSDLESITPSAMHPSPGLPSSRKMTVKQPYESSGVQKQMENIPTESKRDIASMSDQEQGDTCSTPEEDDLPISFSSAAPVLQCKTEIVSEELEPQLSPGEIPAESLSVKNHGTDAYNDFDSMQEHTPISAVHRTHDTKLFHDKFFPANPSPHELLRRAGNKRPRESSIDRYAPYSEKSHQHYLQSSAKGFNPSSPLHTKISRRSEVEDLPSCSSSTNVTHVRESQTRQSFLCEFCDIMFFQRAMYLMHAGLHAPHNPWCCTVCNQTFTEKYSFTSHFINQH